MPSRLANHEPRRPKWRIDHARPDEGHFFPGELGLLLGVPEINHRQLRAIHGLVRHQAGNPIPKDVDQRGSPRDKAWRWSRFTFLDVIATREVVRLCLEPDGTLPNRLRLHRIRVACDALRTIGFINPLVELDLEIHGGQVVVRTSDTLIDAKTGQARFDSAEADLRQYGLMEDEQLVELLNRVRSEFRATDPSRGFRWLIRNQSKYP